MMKKAKRARRQWWRITVENYGSFGFYGTERESEALRKHKANRLMKKPNPNALPTPQPKPVP